MVVHANDHRHEHNRVVEEMYLDAKLGKQQLQKTNRHWRAEPRVMCESLILQNCVLDVMPKLDHERDGPPPTRGAGKTFSQRPDTNEHHDRVTVVHQLGAHEPREKETEHAASFWSWPAEHVNLIRLREMLGPVCQHDNHQEIECAFVPNAVQLFVKSEVGGSNPRVMCGY